MKSKTTLTKRTKRHSLVAKYMAGWHIYTEINAKTKQRLWHKHTQKEHCINGTVYYQLSDAFNLG